MPSRRDVRGPTFRQPPLAVDELIPGGLYFHFDSHSIVGKVCRVNGWFRIVGIVRLQQGTAKKGKRRRDVAPCGPFVTSAVDDTARLRGSCLRACYALWMVAKLKKSHKTRYPRIRSRPSRVQSR